MNIYRNMNYKRISYRFLAFVGIFVVNIGCLAQNNMKGIAGKINDIINLQEVEIISPKEDNEMMNEPMSTTEIDLQDMEHLHLTSMKGVSDLVPNFFIPDYGSRLTSAIYVRGIGSRINTPAVGLYVDNFPYLDKSAFDFNFYDIDKIVILRGPQGTLYGKNTMGGLIKVTTKNPFRYQGTDVKMGYATQNNHHTLSLTHYGKVGKRLAYSFGGYYEGGDGFFRNSDTGKKVDDLQAVGGRIRALYLPADNIKMDFNLGYDYSDEGAYPYYYTSDKEERAEGELYDKITANHKGRYRRGLMNAGVGLEYKTPDFILNSYTAFQNINDRMFMDQDFIRKELYTLEQKQNINALNEEITIRDNHSKLEEKAHQILGDFNYHWLVGINTSYQWLKTEAPVTFGNEGISSLIEDPTNNIFKRVKAEYPKMPNMSLNVTDNEFLVNNDIQTPVMSLGIFHQSTLNIGLWSILAGMRLEYEHTHLDYQSDCNLNYEFGISMPPYMNMTYPELKASPRLEGVERNDYVQLLPKLTVKYRVDEIMNDFVYATISKGYRSGGYNIQMLSELVEGELRGEMMDGVNDVSGMGMMSKYVDLKSLKTTTNIDDVVFKPEYSWNWELGTKLTVLTSDSPIFLDASVFYIKTYNQQIARFSHEGLGRMMVNAGKSRSWGAELSATTSFKKFDLNLNYGFTNAKFLEYNDEKNDFKDNYVPFVPMHTINGGVAYCFPVKKITCTLGMNCSASGRIYWTEANDHYQDLYATLGAFASVNYKNINILLWGKNLTSTRYNTFYFESMNRGFEQHGKPFQIGIDFKLSIK